MFKSKKQEDKELTAKNNFESQQFLKEYADLVKKHKRKLVAVLDFSPYGIQAKEILIEFEPQSNIVVPKTEIIKP